MGTDTGLSIMEKDFIDRMIERTKKEDALREKGIIILNDYRLEKARRKD